MTAINIVDERRSIVALLHPPAKFEWAKVRAKLDDDILPSELLRRRHESSSEVVDLTTHAQSLIDAWESDGTQFLTYLDADYPHQFREVFDYPPFVFSRGKLPEAGIVEHSIAIVGSRKADDWAIGATRAIAQALTEERITVVAGLAAGIDAEAHRASMEARGRTVGIIGTGIRQYYPATSRSLQRRMESEGLVLSQFWPDAAPTKASFPMRNGVMSAYAQATLIIQASEKSGTRHQAWQAVKHGRPLIISDRVADATTWGRQLVDDELTDAIVVTGVEEAIRAAITATRRMDSSALLPRLEGV